MELTADEIFEKMCPLLIIAETEMKFNLASSF